MNALSHALHCLYNSYIVFIKVDSIEGTNLHSYIYFPPSVCEKIWLFIFFSNSVTISKKDHI